jgi:hypothetical protein
VLLAVIVIAFPFDEVFQLPLGLSVTFILIGALALFAVARRSGELMRVAFSALALPVWAYLLFATGLELRHEVSSLAVLFRVFQMCMALLVFASICRDVKAVRVLITTTIVVGTAIAVVTIPSTFGIYGGLETGSSNEVRGARSEAVQGTVVGEGGINGVALIMSLSGVLAVALALNPAYRSRRLILLTAGVLSMTGAVLTASRGATLAAAAGLFVAVLAVRVGRWRAMSVGALAVLAVVLIVPSAAFTRLHSPYDAQQGKSDPRSELYESVFEAADDWIPIGVGAAAYYGNWGKEHGFAKDRLQPWLGVKGTHNGYTQVAVLWGLPTVLALLWLVGRLMYRIAVSRVDDSLRVPLLATVVVLAAEMMVAHDIYDKDYAIWFGATLGVLFWGVGRAPDDDDGEGDLGEGDRGEVRGEEPYSVAGQEKGLQLPAWTRT